MNSLNNSDSTSEMSGPEVHGEKPGYSSYGKEANIPIRFELRVLVEEKKPQNSNRTGILYVMVNQADKPPESFGYGLPE